jgi:hypothetical protein
MRAMDRAIAWRSALLQPLLIAWCGRVAGSNRIERASWT